MLQQLNPPLPMQTPRGPGLAHFVLDYGPESHLLWVVFLDTDGACWTVPNPEVRLSANWSLGRRPGQGADRSASCQACRTPGPLLAPAPRVAAPAGA
jgi:hypothetical protein